MATITFPRVHIPRHPLWMAAYEGACALWQRALTERSHEPANAAAGALCARYADAPALDAWLAEFYAQPARGWLLAWLEWEAYQATGDAARLARVLPALVEQFAWRKAHRRRVSGLYGDEAESRAPTEPYARLDRTAQQTLAAECIAHAARVLQHDELAAQFEDEWQAHCALLNDQCWDARAQFYFDLQDDGAHAHAKTSAVGWALLAGAPSAAQSQALARQLADRATFWRVHVFPSLSADHPRYADRGALWRGSVWPLENYALIKGLERSAHPALAFRAADNHLTTVSHVFKETQSLWENYAPEYIEPGSIARPDQLAGALAPLALCIETLLGLRLDAPARTLHWQPRLAEAFAIEGLRLGANILSIHVNAHMQTLQARIESSAPLRLHLVGADGEQWLDVRETLTCEVQPTVS